MAPSIITWNRLEPLDDSAKLDSSLSAQTADPLWLLHRQWQFAELEANDAGSPVGVTVTRTESPLSGPGRATRATVALQPRTTRRRCRSSL